MSLDPSYDIGMVSMKYVTFEVRRVDLRQT